MRQHIKEAMFGDIIYLVFPTYQAAQRALRDPPSGAIVSISSMRWTWEYVAGAITFTHTKVDPRKFEGVLADIRFVDNAEMVAPEYFCDVAAHRTLRYRERRACEQRKRK